MRRRSVRRHHRTTGEPGQGVDGPLLCPVTTKPAPKPAARRAICVVAAAKRLWCKRMNSSGADGPSNPQRAETRLVTAGRDPKAQKGFVNPAVFHGSTVLYPTADDLHAHR